MKRTARNWLDWECLATACGLWFLNSRSVEFLSKKRVDNFFFSYFSCFFNPSFQMVKEVPRPVQHINDNARSLAAFMNFH